MKKFCSLLIAILICIFAISPVYANNNVSSIQIKDVGNVTIPDLQQTPDYYNEVNTKSDLNSIVVQPKSLQGQSYKYLSVPVYAQDNSDYCGPACLKMVLQCLQGSSPSQSTLASASGTTQSGGTYVYMMRNTLNSYLGSHIYDYYLTGSVNLTNRSIISLNHGDPVVYHVMTSGLYGYENNYGHYVVGTGYYTAWNASGTVASNITYNDPWYGDGGDCLGAHTITFSQMTTAVNNNGGYYICW